MAVGGGVGAEGEVRDTEDAVPHTSVRSLLLNEEHAALTRATMFGSFGNALFVPKRDEP